jgi:hypothetical protein
MARLVLLVRCGACGRVFDTGIRMDRRNFARATLASNYHTCPACGQRGTYHKDNYVVREDAPARDRSPGGQNGHTADREGSAG